MFFFYVCSSVIDIVPVIMAMDKDTAAMLDRVSIMVISVEYSEMEDSFNQIRNPV